MTPDRSSTTASIVCVARGIGISRTRRDPGAASFAPSWIRPALSGLDRDSISVRALRFALRAVSLGIIDHNTIRMLLIDSYLRQWMLSGCRQLVIVGAGLDARSWRMPELRDVRVFELDNSLTQQLKVKTASTLRPLAAQVGFVQADIEQEDLAQPLLRAGYCATEPAAWVCEGVTPYLDVGSIVRLLKSVSATSAVGSKLALSYIAPVENGLATIGRSLTKRFVSTLGEPARGMVPKAEMQRFVEAAELKLIEDIAWPEWLERLDMPIRLPNLLRERLLIAAKVTQP